MCRNDLDRADVVKRDQHWLEHGQIEHHGVRVNVSTQTVHPRYAMVGAWEITNHVHEQCGQIQR